MLNTLSVKNLKLQKRQQASTVLGLFMKPSDRNTVLLDFLTSVFKEINGFQKRDEVTHNYIYVMLLQYHQNTQSLNSYIKR